MTDHFDLIYAIGDVHGRADLLAALLDAIEAEIAGDGREAAIFFLGDVVDRGPDSSGALRLVGEALTRRPGSRLILGNHDNCFLGFLLRRITPRQFEGWLEQGGEETLKSYGTSAREPASARAKIIAEHRDHANLLAKASIIVVDSDFAFVHAGVDPHRPIDAQLREDCLFIRAPFMRHVGRLSRVVVHGHTPQRPPRPVVTENRISIDTGAYFSDVLCAAVIDRPRRSLRFLATSNSSSRVEPVSAITSDRGFGTVLDQWSTATGKL